MTSEQENEETTATLTYDRNQATRFGIQPVDIDNVLYDAPALGYGRYSAARGGFCHACGATAPTCSVIRP